MWMWRLLGAHVCMCARVCVRVYVRACGRARVRVFVCRCVCVCATVRVAKSWGSDLCRQLALFRIHDCAS